jgi:hypothetical protein
MGVAIDPSFIGLVNAILLEKDELVNDEGNLLSSLTRFPRL